MRPDDVESLVQIVADLQDGAERQSATCAVMRRTLHWLGREALAGHRLDNRHALNAIEAALADGMGERMLVQIKEAERIRAGLCLNARREQAVAAVMAAVRDFLAGNKGSAEIANAVAALDRMES